MIFSDEARFSKHTVAACGDGLLAMVKDSQTDTHLGPGAYYVQQNESVRGGWQKRSFSKREPMSPGTRVVDRNHHYTAGVMLPGGGIAEAAKMHSALSSPGPGHYLGTKPFFSPSKSSVASKANAGAMGDTANSSQSRPRSAGSFRTTPGSPRIASPHTHIRSGILFHSKPGTDSGVGPGYYAPLTSSFVTKSFNARVNQKGTPSPKRSPQRVGSAGGGSRGGATFSPSRSQSQQGDVSALSFSASYPFQTF